MHHLIPQGNKIDSAGKYGCGWSLAGIKMWVRQKHCSLTVGKRTASCCAPHTHWAWYIQFLSCAEVVWRTPNWLYTAGAWGKQWTRRNESSSFNSAQTVWKCRERNQYTGWSEGRRSCGCLLVCISNSDSVKGRIIENTKGPQMDLCFEAALRGKKPSNYKIECG